jgi:hypothetical protein
MDLEDLFGDLDYSTLGVAVILWALAAAALWFLPSALGVVEYPLWIRIVGTIIILPISYIVVQLIGNR